ncbi:hypothetical protein [Kitasatospora nipponensis]
MSRAEGPGAEPADREPQGCLVAAVRVPARVVAVLVVMPLGFCWELLRAAARALAGVLTVAARWLERAAGMLWRVLVVRPCGLLYRHLLTPLGRALAAVGRVVGRALAAAGRVLAAGLRLLARALLVVGRVLKAAVEAGATGLGELVGLLLGVLVVVPAAFLLRRLLIPLGRHLGRWSLVPLKLLSRYLIVPLGRALVALVDGVNRGLTLLLEVALPAVARALYRYLLLPLGRALAAAVRLLGAGAGLLAHALVRLLVLTVRGLRIAIEALVEYALVRPARAAWRYLLVPAGRALGWLVTRLWRHLLLPLGRPLLGGLGQVVTWAWRLGGQLWRLLVMRPCRWVRRDLWWPLKAEVRRAARAAAATVRETLREVRRSLFG